MKAAFLIFSTTFILFFCGQQVVAQDSVTSTPVAVVQTVPVVAPIETVQVAEPAAPPKWAEQLIVTAQELPVIGPIITKALLYLGIVSSILTALIACLLTMLNAISGIASLTGLAKYADKIQMFKNGKIMYWLKYLSMFNAKKNVPAQPTEEKKAA
jgi:hypothetical protein